MLLRPNSIADIRRNRYNVAVAGRRRREGIMLEIRKNKRDESLWKKRCDGLDANQKNSYALYCAPPPDIKKLTNLPSTVAGDSAKELEEATQDFLNWYITYAEFLMSEGCISFEFEAAWTLSKLVSESTKMLINDGAVPIMVRLLSSPNNDAREQAVCALGQIAGESTTCRDLVLRHDALMPLLSLLAQMNEHSSMSLFRNATWALSNFLKGKPKPPFDLVEPALVALGYLIMLNDEQVLTDACWALSYLSDGTNDDIQIVIEAIVCWRLVELLGHSSAAVVVPALRTVGNIATGDHLQTQRVINVGALSYLLNLLTNNHEKSVKKEACWAISNIAAGNKEQIQEIMEAGLIPPLLNILQNAELEIKKEATWAISNATSGGTNEQIKFMVSEGGIKALCDLLLCPDATIVTLCLQSLQNILKIGEADNNIYVAMINDADGFENIENLQTHENYEIYVNSVKILETYLPEEYLYNVAFHFGGNDSSAPSAAFSFI